MQKLLLKLTGLSLVLGVLFFSSCGDDPVITNPLGPDIQLTSGTDVLTADADLEVGQSFSVALRLSKGDAQLQSLAINAGSDKLDDALFTINGGAITTNNPLLITGADKDGATFTLAINAPAGQMVGDITTYQFTVTDDAGETASTDIVITIVGPATTPLDQTLTGVLFNQAGPSGTGGLDLDEGAGVGSSDDKAEIVDMGIDCSTSTVFWRKQMGSANGAILRKVDPTQVENFNFDNVDNKEVILAAYDTGTEGSDADRDSCSNGGTVTDVTDTIAEGDVFAVFANGTYYLFRVDMINDVDGNGDSYSLTIKY